MMRVYSTQVGGETKFVWSELIKELSGEMQQINSILKLALIEEEFHQT